MEKEESTVRTAGASLRHSNCSKDSKEHGEIVGQRVGGGVDDGQKNGDTGK